MNTRCSADARYIIYSDALEDPVGKNDWTLVKQNYNSSGLMPGCVLEADGGKVKKYAP